MTVTFLGIIAGNGTKIVAEIANISGFTSVMGNMGKYLSALDKYLCENQVFVAKLVKWREELNVPLDDILVLRQVKYFL